jgi:hypothetical protein
MPKNGKPREQLRRRNRPEEWVALPPKCTLRPPAWPLPKASTAESALWKRLWALPVAAFWHEQAVEPSIVARYVRLALSKPEHAAVGRLETELGLTPAALARLRLVVETPEPEPEPGPDPYAHLAKDAK